MCVCVCVCVNHCKKRFVSLLVRTNWPPLDFSKRALHDELYNTFYHMNDPIGNFRMFRWIDDNIVKMVSNVHMGTKDEAVIRPPRKKPRLNGFNRKHI